ncbi:MAG: nucleotidyl transferase AbiEii/AbiGii toxin family protein [Gammaproteobacteria bacterium]
MIRSIVPDRPLDPTLLHILRALDEEARAVGIDTMLIGATARDILLTHVFGLPTGRATRDVDFAVGVESWPHFEHLKQRLSAKRGFTASETSAQRLYYHNGPGDHGYPLDLVPFGALATDAGTIAWPPDMAIVMSVVGYQDVFAASEQVQCAPDLISRVASLPGLAVLKLIAWSDRGAETQKDAQDLYHLMAHYGDAGNGERLYESEYAILEAAGYDPDLAAACLLGRDVARLVTHETRRMLCQIIDTRRDRLTLAMRSSTRLLADAYERVGARLDQFRTGLSTDAEPHA